MRWICMGLCFLALSFPGAINAEASKDGKHNSSFCSTWDRNYWQTFDGYMFQFPGMCEYNLVSVCHSLSQNFSVHMKREDINGNPTVSYVVVTFSELSFHISKSLVTVNGEVHVMPFNSKGVQLDKNSGSFKLQAKDGIVVTWNRDDTITVELDADFANKTCGLCGDFNGDPDNEFIHDDHRISPNEFGKKQKVQLPNDDCEDPNEEDD